MLTNLYLHIKIQVSTMYALLQWSGIQSYTKFMWILELRHVVCVWNI